MCKYVYRYIECITDQSNWPGPFSLVVMCSLYNLGVLSSILGLGAQLNFLYRFFSSYYSGAMTRMITVGAQGLSSGCGAKKNLDYNSFP